MPTIHVSAIFAREGRALLARPAGSAEWSLPGGLLTDADASVEDALVRSLAGLAELEVEDVEFLDTVYDRQADGVVVHNLFAVLSATDVLPENGRHEGAELRWTPVGQLGETAMAPWLAEALPALLAGEPAPEQDVDLGGLAVALDAEIELPGALPRLQAAPVWIVTGPAGAGKSTVSRALCDRFERAAHIDVDSIRWRMVVSGYVAPESKGGEAKEARRQRALATRNACSLARNFAEAGFVAVIDDVLEQTEELDLYLAELAGLEVSFVTLLPDAGALRARDHGRDPEDQMGERSEELRRIIAGNGEWRGLRLDSSTWSVEQTVEMILARRDEALAAVAGVWPE